MPVWSRMAWTTKLGLAVAIGEMLIFVDPLPPLDLLSTSPILLLISTSPIWIKSPIVEAVRAIDISHRGSSACHHSWKQVGDWLSTLSAQQTVPPSAAPIAPPEEGDVLPSQNTLFSYQTALPLT